MAEAGCALKSIAKPVNKRKKKLLVINFEFNIVKRQADF
jgi:hypothetical protein